MKQKQNHKPTHEIWHVAGEGETARWTKIGVGWTHRDGDGMNLAVNYSPLVEGRTVVRPVKPREEDAE